MKTSLLLTILAITALTGLPAKALALSDTYYDFAFSINVPDGAPITGEIIGLENDATSVPYDIIINSDPYNPAVGAGDYSLVENGYELSPFVADTFTVSDGIITGTGAANGDRGTGLIEYKVSSEPNSLTAYNFNAFGNINGQGSTNYPYFKGNDDGFSGITYFDGTISAVPEPSQWCWAIFLIVAGATFWRRSIRAV